MNDNTNKAPYGYCPTCGKMGKEIVAHMVACVNGHMHPASKMLDAPPKQHDGLPVSGYRAQSASNVELVNKMKQAEEGILRMLDALGTSPEFDKRWLAIGRTSIEQGFMAVNRSIFKPTRVTMPGDETDVSAL